ncbi:hypothetical protein ACH3XW_46430 [Acanthocheilonema viteae]
MKVKELEKYPGRIGKQYSQEEQELHCAFQTTLLRNANHKTSGNVLNAQRRHFQFEGLLIMGTVNSNKTGE